MEPTIVYFRVTGIGPSSSEPIDRIASTAIEAEKQFHAVLRICGRAGSVEIYGLGGRTISREKIRTLARAEENNLNRTPGKTGGEP